MHLQGATRSGWRTRAWLAAAAVLAVPAASAASTGLSTWHLVLALLGLVAACGATLELAGEHRELVVFQSSLDTLSGVLGTGAVLLTFALAPLERVGGVSALEATLVLGCLAVLVVVTGLAATLVGEVGRVGDRRPAVLLAAATALLAAATAHVLGATGVLQVPPSLVLVAAGLGGACGLVLLVLPRPRRLHRRATRVTQLAPGSFAVIAEAALALLLAPPSWTFRLVVVVAVGALLTAGLRLALLLRDVTSLHAARALAVTDEVTGLSNRRALLADATALVQQPGAGASLLVLDVDGLHSVTDAWGREVGDALLRQVAARFSETVPRHPDHPTTVARVDGAVFAVLLHTGGAALADGHARQLLAALEEPFALPQGSVRLSAAAGIAVLHAVVAAEAGGAAVDALRRAEAAATVSRTHDGEPVVHDAALDEAVAARAAMAAALTAAVEGGQLVLHYQPQLALGGAVVQGAEALVRWQDPEHGLVPPDVFVPLAEELGLQGALTRWVVGEALREVARWRAAGCAVPVSVNLSPSDLQPALVDDVARALAEAGVPGSALVLEITETGIVSDAQGAAEVLSALGDLGVEISIDDYGTGYSSLSLLMELPVTELKIDRVFVRGLGEDARSAVVVRTTVDLAHSLGLRVVAEGVETPEVLALLSDLGCDVSQGYLHSRPLPAAEVRAWLLDGSVQQRLAQQAPRSVRPAAVSGP